MALKCKKTHPVELLIKSSTFINWTIIWIGEVGDDDMLHLEKLLDSASKYEKAMWNCSVFSE
eukprot:12556142-Ditylum_brightwellii.AAC.1